MPTIIPQIPQNKLSHLRYIYEHGSFMYYSYRGNHFDNAPDNFNKTTLNYLHDRGLITQVYDNHFGDIWDITAFGALVLTQLDPEYAELDLKLLFKRLNQTYETWLPDSGIGIFKRDNQSQKNQENVRAIGSREGMS